MSETCRELFLRRNAWQKDAFDELKCKLNATKDNPFLTYDGVQDTCLVMVYGKSQIGKSTLILKLIGIRDGDCFTEVYNTLRAEVPQGDSSTATAIIYSQSATDQYAMAFGKAEDAAISKKYYSEQELKQELKKVREDVEHKRRTAADEILYIDIPKKFFIEDPAVGRIRIMDMPGVDSSNAKEHPHVANLMDRYLLISQVCLIVCGSSDIQSLEKLELPHNIQWKSLPSRFMVVCTMAYSAKSIEKEYFADGVGRAEGFEKYIKTTYQKTFERVMGAGCQLELFPVDLGNSLKMMKEPLSEKDQAEVDETLEHTLRALRQSIVRREGMRFQASIELLRSKVNTYRGKELSDARNKIQRLKSEIFLDRDNIRRAENALKELDKNEEKSEYQQKCECLKATEDALKNLRQLTAEFNRNLEYKINYAVRENVKERHLYRETTEGWYLKDQRASESVFLSDRYAFAAVLSCIKTEVENYWKQCEPCLKKGNVRVTRSEDNGDDKNHKGCAISVIDAIHVRVKSEYYQLYYPKGLFHPKVTNVNIAEYNHGIAELTVQYLNDNYSRIWAAQLEQNQKRLRESVETYNRLVAKRRNVISRNKEKLQADQKMLRDAEICQREIETQRQQDEKWLQVSLEIAERAYTVRRRQILEKICTLSPPEEKMKWFLLLALTEQDYKKAVQK